jgi:putative transposase
MRLPRLKVPSGQGAAVYHCLSRVVNRDFVLRAPEKEQFVALLRRHERLCGVRVLTYCVMANHFHLLVEVPQRPPEAWDDGELIAHLKKCGGSASLEKQLRQLRSQGAPEAADALRESYLKRMWDLSFFMKGLKQEFTQWFNRRHHRKGTLWEERFKSVLVEGSGPVLETMAAYIDLNSVRAGLGEDPKGYRWCGYAEAVAGGKEAKAGLMNVVGKEKPLERYRMLVFAGAEERGLDKENRPLRRGVPQARIRAVLERKGKLTKEEMLRCRVRYFCDGAILGSKEFVNQVFEVNRKRFGTQRKDGARKMRFVEVPGFYALRDLQLRPIG